MRRERQLLEDVLASLSSIETSWRDAHADAVVGLIERLPARESYSGDDVAWLLEQDFNAGITLIRLALDLSKDEFSAVLRALLSDASAGIRTFREDRSRFLAALLEMGIAARLQELVHTPVTWRTLLTERLKSGRGSAIKGQARGRGLEDFVEVIVERVFGGGAYHCRCRFTGKHGQSTEKADFAIPSRTDPRILIEVKAYGATGSKQTDVLGDIARIVEQKRHDTDLLLVTDGTTWKARVNDLRKLIAMQHAGAITRIYTRASAEALEDDLRELRRDHAL